MGRVVVLGFLAVVFSLKPASAAAVERSISTSRQFIVYGTNVTVRGAICDFGERTKRELLTLLGQRDGWTTPIVVNAQFAQANLPELPRLSVALGQTGFGLKLQLDLVIDSEVSRPEIRHELLRALVLEMMYRGHPTIPAGTAYTSPPDWLLDGVPAEHSDLSRDRVTTILALPVAARNVLPLEKFLAQRPQLLEGPGQVLYRAYSFALVDLLSHEADGPGRLARFVADLPASSNDPLADLRLHFPGLFDLERAEETWQKQVARLATDQPYQLMSSAETERVLREKLRFKISERCVEKSFELTEFPVFLKFKSTTKVLRSLVHDLTALSIRANPIYAPTIAEYAEVTALLLRGKTSRVARRLERLETSRQAVGAQMQEIDDYLNWFEATSLARPSGKFADYMKAAEREARSEQSRRDPISVYLDVLETQFDH